MMPPTSAERPSLSWYGGRCPLCAHLPYSNPLNRLGCSLRTATMSCPLSHTCYRAALAVSYTKTTFLLAMFGPATAGASLGSAVVIIGVKRYTHEVMFEHLWPPRGCCACSMNSMLLALAAVLNVCAWPHSSACWGWTQLALVHALQSSLLWSALGATPSKAPRAGPRLSQDVSGITNTCHAYKYAMASWKHLARSVAARDCACTKSRLTLCLAPQSRCGWMQQSLLCIEHVHVRQHRAPVCTPCWLTLAAALKCTASPTGLMWGLSFLLA